MRRIVAFSKWDELKLKKLSENAPGGFWTNFHNFQWQNYPKGRPVASKIAFLLMETTKNCQIYEKFFGSHTVLKNTKVTRSGFANKVI